MPCKLIQHNLLRFISSEAHCTCRGRKGGGKEGREGGREFRARGEGWGRGLRESVCVVVWCIHWSMQHLQNLNPRLNWETQKPQTDVTSPATRFHVMEFKSSDKQRDHSSALTMRFTAHTATSSQGWPSCWGDQGVMCPKSQAPQWGPWGWRCSLTSWGTLKFGTA